MSSRWFQRHIFLAAIVALLGGAFLGVQPVLAAPLTYEEFLERARALHAGETRAAIVASLGVPAAQGETFLAYDLTGLPQYPADLPIGVQVFPNFKITLQDGAMAGEIQWAWIDTIGMPPPPPMTYAKFVARALSLRAGATRAHIIAALGKPNKEGATYLEYDLIGLKGMPPPPGTTVYYAAEFKLKDGRMTGTVNWAWMDTTGPGTSAPPPKP